MATRTHRERAYARTRLVAATIGIAYLAFSGWLSTTLNIWQDEWYSLRTTSHGLRFAWSSAIGFEGIPPLYPLALDAWRHLDGSVFFARLLSISCVALAALVCAWFARRYLTRVSPLLVMAASAFNPFSIYAAVEIRLYAMALLCSAAIVVTFFVAFVRDDVDYRARAFFAVACVIGIYVQYFNGALVVGGALALVMLRRWAALRGYGLAILATTIACAPIALFLTQQLGVPRSLDEHHIDVLPELQAMASFVFPHDALSNWFSDRRNVLYDVAVIATIAVLVRARPRATIAVRVLSAFVLACVAFYPIAAVGLHQVFVYPRHAVVAVVPLLLLTFALVDSVAGSVALVARTYGSVYALCTGFALFATYYDLAKPGDFERAAMFIREHARPGERIYAFDQEMVGPLQYYDRVDRIVPLPKPLRFDRFDATQFRFRSAADVRAKIGRVRPGTRVLLYRGDVCYDPADQFGCRYLEDVVRKDYRTVASLDLRSANVRELVRRAR